MKTNLLSENFCSGSLKAKNTLALLVGFRFFLFKPDEARAFADGSTTHDGAVRMTNRKHVPHVVARIPPMSNWLHSALFTANQSHRFTFQNERMVHEEWPRNELTCDLLVYCPLKAPEMTIS